MRGRERAACFRGRMTAARQHSEMGVQRGVEPQRSDIIVAKRKRSCPLAAERTLASAEVSST